MQARDHPRICGEQYIREHAPGCGWGSSPHLRGTEAYVTIGLCRARIIPASAGNRRRPRVARRYGEDHPRICGEQMMRGIGPDGKKGSSPHLRGTVYSILDAGDFCGIIPASAGNRGPTRYPGYEGKDHPRICGEQSCAWRIKFATLGSSPHLRGTGTGSSRNLGRYGIIPASAGNSLHCTGR